MSLAKLLPPPPAPDSGAQKRDLALVLEVQKQRTPELVRRALADNELSIFRITEALDPTFLAEFEAARAELRRALICAIPNKALKRHRADDVADCARESR